MDVQILDHPFEALPVVVVPGAVATTLLGPQVDHLSGEVGRVGDRARHTEREDHVHQLAEVVREILIHPEEEELVLAECVQRSERSPEEELIHGKGESTSEQEGGTFLEGDPEQSLRR